MQFVKSELIKLTIVETMINVINTMCINIALCSWPSQQY